MMKPEALSRFKNWLSVFLFGMVILMPHSLSEKDFNQYDSLFQAASHKYQVPWRWLKAVALIESSLGRNPRVQIGLVNPTSVLSDSEDGLSNGIMQVTRSTARDILNLPHLSDNSVRALLNDPEQSIDLGARYLSQLMRMFKGDLMKTIMAYNEGPGNVRKGKLVKDYFLKFNSHLQDILAMQPGDSDEVMEA